MIKSRKLKITKLIAYFSNYLCFYCKLRRHIQLASIQDSFSKPVMKYYLHPPVHDCNLLPPLTMDWSLIFSSFIWIIYMYNFFFLGALVLFLFNIIVMSRCYDYWFKYVYPYRNSFQEVCLCVIMCNAGIRSKWMVVGRINSSWWRLP